MLAAGGAMLLIVFLTVLLLWKNQLQRFPCFLKLLPFALPLPFLANSFGWYIAEGGRQPWIVVGLQKTAAAFSPNLTPGEVFISLMGFTIIYLILAAAALYAAVRFIRRTPAADDRRDA